MIVFKKEYKNKKVYVRGYGSIDTSKEKPEFVAKLATKPEFRNLAKMIEGEEKKKSKSK